VKIGTCSFSASSSSIFRKLSDADFDIISRVHVGKRPANVAKISTEHSCKRYNADWHGCTVSGAVPTACVRLLQSGEKTTQSGAHIPTAWRTTCFRERGSVTWRYTMITQSYSSVSALFAGALLKIELPSIIIGAQTRQSTRE
jgi:hypothetical protein